MGVGVRRQGWGWGRERSTGRTPSGARGPPRKAGLASGRAGSRSRPRPLWALPSARCAQNSRPGARSPTLEGGSPSPDHGKTEGGKKRRTNSPQRRLRPRSGRVVPVATGLAESGRAARLTGRDPWALIAALMLMMIFLKSQQPPV